MPRAKIINDSISYEYMGFAIYCMRCLLLIVYKTSPKNFKFPIIMNSDVI
jgi:hypothetical protein